MEHRIALVMGNSSYSNISRLRNPIKDATSLGRELQKLGFELTGGGPLLDARKGAMDAAIHDFTKALSRDSIAFFYFAGHGLQVGGANYMIPVEAGGARDTHIEAELVDVQRVLSGMEQARTKLNLIVLDACRNDPFQGRSFRSTSGLAPMQAASGTILAYATQPGNVALDGQGENSPYLEAWLEMLRQPDIEARELLNQIGILVRQRTGGRQVPWMSSSPVETRFVFRVEETMAPPPTADSGGAAWWLPATKVGEPAVAGGSIQEAIDSAPEGGRVEIAPGRHVGRLRIGKSIELVSAGQCSIECEEGEEPLVRIDGGQVRLAGLTLRSGAGPRTVDVYGGAVTLENCVLSSAQPEQIGETMGVEAMGVTAEIRLAKTRLEGYSWAVAVSGASRLELDGCEFLGKSRRGQPSNRGIMAVLLRDEAQGDLRDVTIAGFQVGMEAMGYARALAVGCRIEEGQTGIIGEGEGVELEAENCEIARLDYGVKTYEKARVSLRDCDLSHAVRGVEAHSDSVIEVAGSKRIAGEEGSCGAHAAGGVVEIRQSRIFGGHQGAMATDGGRLTLSDCEIFDVAGTCAEGDETGILTIRSCDLHHAGRTGIWWWGAAEVENCRIHGNGLHGLEFEKSATFRVSQSKVYRNQQSGVVCREQAKGMVEGCCIVRHGLLGVGIDGGSEVTVKGTIIRQTAGPAIDVSSTRPATIKDCALNRNNYPLIRLEKGSKVIQEGNWLSPQSRCKPQAGSGGRYNSCTNMDFFYAGFSEVIDWVENWAKQNLWEWSRNMPEISADGRRAIYYFQRNFTRAEKLEVLSARELIRAGLLALPKGLNVNVVNLPYELHMKISLEAEDFVPGMDRVTVNVEEEEHIDRYEMTGKPIGDGLKAQSDIMAHQRGCLLLHQIHLNGLSP